MNCLRRHRCQGDTHSKKRYWRGCPGGGQQGAGTPENCSDTRLTVWGFIVMRLVSGLSLANHWLRVLPGARIAQPAWMLARRLLGGGRTRGVSFWPFPNSSCWCWLISSMFLTTTSSDKTTHANSYYDIWPGWGLSVSVFPLTSLQCQTSKQGEKMWWTWRQAGISKYSCVLGNLPLEWSEGASLFLWT